MLDHMTLDYNIKYWFVLILLAHTEIVSKQRFHTSKKLNVVLIEKKCKLISARFPQSALKGQFTQTITAHTKTV